MEVLVFILVMLLLFGKQLSSFAGGVFSQQNAVPFTTPTNSLTLPNSTGQDTTNPPSAQPAPWHNPCNISSLNPSPSPSLPMNPVAVAVVKTGAVNRVVAPVSYK